MFAWLSNIFRARGKLSNRLLFELFDGTRFVKRDPWEIYRKLYNDEEFVPLQMLAAAFEMEEPELGKCIRCCHRAFGTHEFDGLTRTGLTIHETLAVLGDFFAYLDELVKKNGGLPMPSPPTGSESSTGQECPPDPTKPCSPSSCSTEESEPGGPLPS
jgi:hypothetical protein